MAIPFRHLTGQSIGWRELGSSRPCSACLELLAWVAPGACWKEWSAWGGGGGGGGENPSTSTRTPSTLILVGEHLEDDESSFEAAVFKGPAEPLGALLEGAAEPLDAILWGLAEPIEAVFGCGGGGGGGLGGGGGGVGSTPIHLRRTLSGLARNLGVGRYRLRLPGGSLSAGRYRSGSARRTHVRFSSPKWTF